MDFTVTIFWTQHLYTDIFACFCHTDCLITALAFDASGGIYNY